MKIIFRALAVLALAGTIVPSILYFNGSLSSERVKWMMLLFTILWFASAPLAEEPEKAGPD